MACPRLLLLVAARAAALVRLAVAPRAPISCSTRTGRAACACAVLCGLCATPFRGLHQAAGARPEGDGHLALSTLCVLLPRPCGQHQFTLLSKDGAPQSAAPPLRKVEGARRVAWPAGGERAGVPSTGMECCALLQKKHTTRPLPLTHGTRLHDSRHPRPRAPQDGSARAAGPRQAGPSLYRHRTHGSTELPAHEAARAPAAAAARSQPLGRSRFVRSGATHRLGRIAAAAAPTAGRMPVISRFGSLVARRQGVSDAARDAAAPRSSVRPAHAGAWLRLATAPYHPILLPVLTAADQPAAAAVPAACRRCACCRCCAACLLLRRLPAAAAACCRRCLVTIVIGMRT